MPNRYSTMKKLFAGILVVFGINAQSAPEVPANESVIDDLRSMALSMTSEKLGLSQENYPNEVWGILMETGFDDGSFTLLVLADGTTSLYFSNGGGSIGSGTHDSVKKASTNLLSGANHYRDKTRPVLEYPYPSSGEVKLGRNGVTSYSAKERELGENRDTLSQLFHASHVVISKLRQVEEARNNK